jgi:LacI family transcriptional regulator
VEDASRAAGYTVLLCNAAEDPEREASYLDLLVDRRVDGLIIAASSIGARQGEWLMAPPIPVVLVNTEVPGSGLPTITSDNLGGGRLATEHLLALGHRLFGYLMPPPRNVDAAARLAGVRAALRAAGCPDDALTLAGGDALVGGGEAAAIDLLERAPDTTAILAYNDLMAIGALRALRHRGRRVPSDASVVGFDDVAVAAYVDPALTTISQRTEEMGRWAVERLIGDGGAEATTVKLPVDLHIRDSTGPPSR